MVFIDLMNMELSVKPFEAEKFRLDYPMMVRELVGERDLVGAYVFDTGLDGGQNDKMRQAIEAFDQIINDMPESEAAFAVAKEALLSRLRTQRTTGMDVLRSYLACRRLGLSEPSDRAVFEKAQNASLADVAATQRKWAKDRNYTYAILGDIKDLDTKFLSTLGPVQQVSLEEIFGY